MVPSQPQLLNCVLCETPFIGEFLEEKRPVFEKVKQMKKAGRDTQMCIGETVQKVCPAVCEDCRRGERRLPFVNFDLEESDA